MGPYKISFVESKKDIREFYDFPIRLYRNEKNWICPLRDDIESRFDPARNELLREGEIVRWLVRGSDGDAVGRIAAFWNREMVEKSEWQPTGGCGYFESINDQQVANMLFNAAAEWLGSRGLEAMDGPVNFGDRDQWWGLLVKGFEFTPLYTNPYNFEYYIELFENYGFQNYFNQYTYSRELSVGALPDTVYERVRRLNQDPSYRFEHIYKRRLFEYAEDFREIYNKAWANFSGVKPMDGEHAQSLMRKLRPIIDENLMYFAYHDNSPIGFFIMVPDLNGVIRPLKGSFGLLQKLRFVWRLKVRKKADRIFAIIFGVVPQFQGKGIESGMITEFEKYIENGRKIPYKSLELAWVGDFNPLMMRMVETIVVARKHKTHTTYRYLFDRNAEFRRAPRMGGKKQQAPESDSPRP